MSFGAGVAAYPALPARVSALAPAFGVYVHVPFCAARCPYCDFNTYAGISDMAPAYLDALALEAKTWVERHGPFPAAGSLFFGGGTPTLLDPPALADAIQTMSSVFSLAPDAEVTVEANPETVGRRALSVLRGAGVNRISIGAQSFSDRSLAALGRAHTTARTREAVAAARAAGFENLSLDLIFGAPGESVEEWCESLDAAIALAPEHLSCYALTVEHATPFGRAVAAGEMEAPDDDLQADKLEAAIDVLARAGYEHYEISNWARPGRACRHNLVYWTQGDYVGLGAGAHSHVRGVRSWNLAAPGAYAVAPERARAGEERLDAAARAEEWLYLRLRLLDPVDLAEAFARLGRDPAPAARALESAGLVSLNGERLALTRRGVLLQTEVALRLGEARAAG